MKNSLFLSTSIAIIIALALALPAYAKRMAPKEVSPIQKNGVEYSAPIEKEGFVVATWIETKKVIWARQIYVIKYEHKKGLEGDVQTCFITNLELKDGKLRIVNERMSEFELDPKTLEVKVLKGSLKVDFSQS